METITRNLRMRIHRRTANGRQYLVAASTLLRPQVLSGSRGPLFYPAEEIAAAADRWNNRPLTLGHHSLLAWNTTVPTLGHIANARVGRRGDLIGDLYFDVKACDKLDRRLVPKLLRGEPIDVSTGLHTTEVNEPGVHNGVRYQAVATRHAPDHLAILLDQPGACSVRDGCGVGITNAEARLTRALARVLNAEVEPLKEPSDHEAEMFPMEDEDFAPPTPGDLTRDVPERGGLLPLKHRPTLKQRMAEKPQPLRDPESYWQEEEVSDDAED